MKGETMCTVVQNASVAAITAADHFRMTHQWTQSYNSFTHQVKQGDHSYHQRWGVKRLWMLKDVLYWLDVVCVDIYHLHSQHLGTTYIISVLCAVMCPKADGMQTL